MCLRVYLLSDFVSSVLLTVHIVCESFLWSKLRNWRLQFHREDAPQGLETFAMLTMAQCVRMSSLSLRDTEVTCCTVGSALTLLVQKADMT